MENKIKKDIDKKALHFCEPLISVFDSVEDTEKTEGMDMLLYSGGVIPNHFYWQNLSIDLSGMKLTKDLYPILLDHDTGKKIGFCDSPVIKDNALHMENIKFVDTEESHEFRRLSKQGFPYQASLYGVPTKVEVVEEGESVVVNGQKLEGPGHIWREFELREGSACVFGYDANTESKAFAEKNIEVNYEISRDESALSRATLTDESIQDKLDKEKIMDFDVKMFAEKQPEDYAKFVAGVTAEAVKEATDKLSAEHSEAVKLAAADLVGANEKLAAADERILSFEKEAAIQAQNALVAAADALWATKLSESDLPETLHKKVKVHVNYEKFIGDEGLDTDAFGAAIDEEIADWADKGITSSVLGSGFSKKDIDAADEAKKLTEKDDDACVDSMLSMI